jgi:hypothetical protein
MLSPIFGVDAIVSRILKINAVMCMRFPRILIGLLWLLAPLSSALAFDPFEAFRPNTFEYDESLAKPWLEQSVTPPAIDLAALRPLQLDRGPLGATLYIDENSLDVNAEDAVVRFWFLLQSDGKYGSVNYEGFRCGTREFKIYAYANAADLTRVTPVENPVWRPIRQNVRDPRHEMAEEYFCSGVLPRKPREIVRSLRGFGRQSTTF